MNKVKLLVLPFALFVVGLLVVGGKVHAAADTCIWTGGGADQNFTTSGNWSTCDNSMIPQAGDTLEFPVNITNRSPVNDMSAGTSFAAISFTGGATSDSNYSITGNAIDLAGGISHSMTTTSGRIDQTLGLNITLTAPQTFSATAGLTVSGTLSMGVNNLTLSGTGVIVITGVISGSGSITNNVVGYVDLRGNNTFTGTVTSTAGYLTAAANGGLGMSSAGTTINTGGSLSFCGGGTGDVTVAEPITLNGAPAGIGYKLYLTGGCSTGGGVDEGEVDPYTILSGTITISADAVVTGTFRDLKITGPLSGSGFKFVVPDGNDFQLVIDTTTNDTSSPNGTTKSALKSTSYSGNQSGTSPSVTYNNEVIVGSGATIGTVYVSGGLLKGIGTVADINMDSGTVAPGMSPGCLASGNLIYTGGTLQIEIGGTTACSGYDQQTVPGTVDRGSATTLTVTKYGGFTPAVGNTFTIISNDGADTVTGTFSGMAEGATFTQDGVTYRINYGGGDGNDVVLTVTAVPGTPNTGTQRVTTPIMAVLLIAISATGLIFVARRMNKIKA